ncbi:MAG TPA: hypothetical protein VHK90_12105, partial [Thermoanaerobaculia bacterium]|nr:hypothetical protein [Thermoanaerobaculia bacterium]
MSPIDVFKFGGVAVGSPEAIRAAVEHVRRAAPRVAAIVSAANGVTDLLLDAAQCALRGDRVAYVSRAKQYQARHDELISALVTNRRRAEELRQLVNDSAHELRSMCDSIAVLRELTTRAQDAVVARGERTMAR